MSSSGGSGFVYRDASLSSRSQSRISSVELGSFSDQDIKAADLESSTSGSATSKQSSQGAAAETQLPANTLAKTYQIPYGIHSDRLTSSSLNMDFILDDTSKGNIKVWPKSMEEYLAINYKQIIPMIKTQCKDGDVIFIARSLLTTLKINTGQCPHSLLCDICIFSSTRPPLVMTLTTSHINVRSLEAYNAKLTKALTEATRTKGEFSLTNGVVQVNTDFTSERVLKKRITRIVKESSFGATGTSLQMNEEKFILAIQVFCDKLCSCYHLGMEQLYFMDIMSNLLIEIFEERQTTEINSRVKDPAILLLREMVFRLANSKIPCHVLCPQEYIEDMKLIATVPTVRIEEGKGHSLVLTSPRLKNTKWEFVVRQDQDYQDLDLESVTPAHATIIQSSEEEKRINEIDKEAAGRCIVKGIISKSIGEREMTTTEREQLEETVLFSLRQFESRAATFFGDLIHSGLKMDEVNKYSAFMEDYLMQCFRQRNLELTRTQQDPPDNDLDTHLHSIRKLTPLLNKGLKLEESPLLRRLIQNDVMSEAGRQSIMGRVTSTSRNRAFITYLCGNFTSKTFRAQFLPILSEDHHDLAIRLEDEMERLTISSKKKNKCTFCKMMDTVNIRRLMDALLQMNEISGSLRRQLSASALPNTVKWTELFKHVRNVEIIMKALEQKNEHLYREFTEKGQSCMECTCDASESQRLSDIVGSDAKNPDGDVANLADFEDDNPTEDISHQVYFEGDDTEGSVVDLADNEDNNSDGDVEGLVYFEEEDNPRPEG